MTVTAISRDWGVVPSIVRMVTDAPLEDIILGGWLATQEESITEVNNGPFEWKSGDAVLVQYPTGNINATTGEEILGDILTYIFPSFVSLAPISPVYPIIFDVIAHAGGGQTDAAQLNVGINDITTVATTADSVRLPNDVLGQTVVVINLGANSVNIFPWPGDKIDNGAMDAAYALASGSRVTFIGTNILKWSSFGLATGS